VTGSPEETVRHRTHTADPWQHERRPESRGSCGLSRVTGSKSSGEGRVHSTIALTGRDLIEFPSEPLNVALVDGRLRDWEVVFQHRVLSQSSRMLVERDVTIRSRYANVELSAAVDDLGIPTAALEQSQQSRSKRFGRTSSGQPTAQSLTGARSTGMCLEHVDNLGAYSIPSEAALLTPSDSVNVIAITSSGNPL